MLTRRIFVALALLGFAGAGQAQTTPPPAPPLRMQLGDAVATGFSGASGAPATNPDQLFIDMNGASARVLRVPSPKSRWDASVVPTPVEWSATAAQIGQVFGVAIGDRPEPNAAPNLYFGATSAYGLHIVRRKPDGAFERLRAGAPGATWAPGQFGLALQGGPGAIYVADGRTGAVNLLANVTLDGVPNPGPGLGAIAYDGKHGQIFASDLYTGMIHRIGLDGADRGRFDHGVTARAQTQAQPVPFDPRARMNIATPAFKADDPASWGLAPPARRVWAVAVEGGRLYYSVEDGLQIWSVGLRETGDFADDARFEATVPGQPGPYPITDIAFSSDGAMVLAQRSAFGAGFYDYSAFTRGGEPRVMRLVRKRPDEPPSPGLWRLAQPRDEYSVGFAQTMRNADGGVAFGYGYDRNERLNLNACGETLFATGDNLRANPTLQDRLQAGGPAATHGVQISPSSALRDPAFPEPWLSQFIDFDGKTDDAGRLGSMGQVRVLTQPCAPPAPAPALAQTGTAAPQTAVAVIDEPVCVGPGCTPDCGGFVCQPCDFANAPDGFCPPPGQPIDLAIKKTGKTSPEPTVGAYSFDLAVTSVTGFYSGAGIITVTDTVPPGMTFTSATGTGWACAALPATAGQTISCVYTGPGPSAPGQSLGNIAIVATATGKPPFPPVRNCARVGVPGASGLMDVAPANNVDCVTIRKPPPVYDVAIKKTGELKEGPAGAAVSFNLAVTNVGSAFAGANVIQVTDVVPAGMTFTAASGTDWTCAALPATAGQTVTCVYTGSGPTAPGQSLGSIAITATAAGEGPWENCAVVGLTPASGIADSNPANDKSCASVSKPPRPNSVSVQKILEDHASGWPAQCSTTAPCTFQIKVTNNSAWPFSGPVVFNDTSGVAMNVISTTLPCTPQPTSIPFVCTGPVTLPAGPSTTTYTVTAIVPMGSIPVKPSTTGQNCASVANPPPVPGSWPSVVNSQNGCVTFEACGYACHMHDASLAKIKITKAPTAATCTPGGLCSYTFTFTDVSGSGYNDPLVFIDTMPAGASAYVPTPPPPLPWSCAPYFGNPNQTECLIRFPNIPPNGSITLTINFQISPTYNQSTLTNCAEFYNGAAPSNLRRAATQNYGMTDAGELRAYLAMRGLSAPQSSPAPGAAASSGTSTLGPDDRSCATVNITQPPSGPDAGSIIVKKQVVNTTSGALPATTYAVAATCGTTTTNLALLDGGSSTINNIPLATPCTVTETPPAPPAVCGAGMAQWTTTITPPSPVSATTAGTTVTVQNTLSCVANPPSGQGKLRIKKVVDAQLSTSMTFPVAVACSDGSNHAVGVTTLLDAEISPLPSTASCMVTEGAAVIPANTCPVGKKGVWTTSYAPAQTVTVGTGATVTITNKLDCVAIAQPARLIAPLVAPIITRPPVVKVDDPRCPPGMARRNGRCVAPPPPTTCRAPMVANDDGACVCPPGTLRRRGMCLDRPPPPTCRPPMVANEQGACMCPPGTLRRGRMCLDRPPPPTCRPPMVPGPDGGCGCAQGMIRRGGACVPPPAACEPPARPDGRGGCVCPRGMIPKGRGCIDQRPRPQEPAPGSDRPRPRLDLPPPGGVRGPPGGPDAPRGQSGEPRPPGSPRP